MRVGVIGLGQIGSGVALCLARAGQLAAVYDIRADAASGLDGVPPVAASPGEVAELSDVLVIAVIDARQVMDVLQSQNGILSRAREGVSVVLLSTISLDDLRSIGEVIGAAGMILIDAGVANGAGAADKAMVLLVGGHEHEVEGIRPVLESISKYVAHMGPPGAGMAAKIARNAIVIGCWRAGHEGGQLAKAMGLNMQEFVKVMDSADNVEFGPTMFIRKDGNPLLEPQLREAREWNRALISKDLKAALSLGAEVGVELPLVELTLKTVSQITGLHAEVKSG